MSFENMSKPELVAIAEQFGAESTGTKAKIIDSLEAEGVTYEFYQNLINATSGEPVGELVPEKPPVVETGNKVVIKYKGKGSYTGPGIKVTVAAPFAVVDEALADRLIEKGPQRFAIASDKEVDAFYN